MPTEEEAEGAVVVRAKKWDKAEKYKFKGLVKEGKLKWDGNAAHRKEICTKHWPSRNKETFRHNWNTLAAEFDPKFISIAELFTNFDSTKRFL